MELVIKKYYKSNKKFHNGSYRFISEICKQMIELKLNTLEMKNFPIKIGLNLGSF